MGKTKKKGVSDKVRSKKHEANTRMNPFEVKINRQKHDVLGKKRTKFDKGMPGVSRSKAVKKRKETLLKEYQQRQKSNKFLDKRIGEKDSELSAEDKMLQRFALEKQKHHEKASQFNLNEEEDELTHYGQSLSEIEKFEDPITSDEEDDDEDEGRIGAKMVAEEHFGGFLTKKEGDGAAEVKHKSWKERMEEIISQSKKEKYERQSEREKAMQLTEKLDQEWKDIRGLIAVSGKKAEAEQPKQKADDFDIMVRELKYEMKGTATDRLKTEEELAKEEKERLEEQEADRMRRMKGLAVDDADVSSKMTHRSADDLDDGFALDKKEKKVRFTVSYKDGKLENDPNKVGKDEDEESGSDDDDEEDEEEEEEGDGEVSDEEKAEEESDEEKAGKEEGSDGDDDDEEEDEDEDEDEEEEDDAMERTSDLESEDEDGSGDEKELKAKDADENLEKEAVAKKGAFKKEAFIRILKERKEMMEKAKKEIPYTFEAPEKYDDLLALLEGHSDEEQLLIIERVRKCHHPSLAEGNKTKLEVLFTLVLEYYGDLAVQDPPHLSLLSALTQHLYELSQQSPLTTGHSFAQLIANKQQMLTDYADAHGGRGLMPSLDLLLYMKLVSLLFPTSDFHHHVTTPTTLLLSQALTQCPVNTRRDVASGLFLCTVFLEYTSFSKRYVPEVINFLSGVLFLAIEKDQKKIEPVIPPFKPIGKNIDFLELKSGKKARNIEVKPVKLTDVFSKRRSLYLGTDEFRLGCIHQCLHLLEKFAELYKDLPAYAEIFAPVKYFTEKLPTKNYPDKLKEQITHLSELISETSSRERQSLILVRQPPPQIKFFEPKVADTFDGKKHRGGSRQQNEKQRLIHKHKKEMKGAIREIRKDASFLAQQKLEERMKKDSERKRKVKEIYHQLSTQEGDINALKRMK